MTAERLICAKLAAWAEVSQIVKSDGSKGGLAVYKSDLLNRLIYGGEIGPSQTPCPVHKGTWSGCAFGWPEDEGVTVKATGFGAIIGPGGKVSPQLQEWRDAGCRCSTHRGSSCTTGWNPDKHCGCVLP